MASQRSKNSQQPAKYVYASTFHLERIQSKHIRHAYYSTRIKSRIPKTTQMNSCNAYMQSAFEGTILSFQSIVRNHLRALYCLVICYINLHHYQIHLVSRSPIETTATQSQKQRVFHLQVRTLTLPVSSALRWKPASLVVNA